jgi:hypothetical protein
MRLPAVFALLALTAVPAAAAPAPTLHFGVFAQTGLRLTGVVWTGSQFLYIENTTNAIYASDSKGGPLRPFAALPSLVEETRCAPSPGRHGFAAGWIYCHVPDNRIFRISRDGTRIELFTSLPTTEESDGMLAFDTVGRFGYRLLAATGRSSDTDPAHRVLYAVDPRGGVKRIGAYPGPAGADGLAVAPADFGVAAGHALLTIDGGEGSGAVVAVGPRGRTRTIARLPDGANPIVVLPRRSATSTAASGFYVSDTTTRNVYFVASTQLRRYAGSVLVGTELNARFFVLQHTRRGYRTVALKHDLPPAEYNFEAATYVP